VLPSGPERDLLDTSLRWALDDFRSFAARSPSWTLGEWTRGHVPPSDLIAVLRRRRLVRSVVFKEPFLAFAPDLGYRAVPGARIVVIHRDGRDCADSLQRKYQVLTDDRLRSNKSVESPMGRPHGTLNVPWWVEKGREDEFVVASSYVRSMWMWREMVQRCIDFAARPEVAASGQVLDVRYDELMRDPVDVGRAVVEHVGQRMTRRVERRLRRAHTRSIGIHASRPAAEIEAATDLARSQLTRLGYLR